MTAVERSHNLRVARMHPLLQFMAGPLLRYDTVDADGVWHGAALIVSTSLPLRPLPLSPLFSLSLCCVCRG